MRLICNKPEQFPEFFFDEDSLCYQELVSVINDGELVLKYEDMENEKKCKKAAFEIEFEGLRAICLNGGGFNSNVFKSVYDPEKHDLMMPFQFDGKGWTISLYSTKEEIDCSVIAKKYSGGGHKGASGFQTDDISFLLNSKIKDLA